MSKSPPTKPKRHYIEVTLHTLHAVRTAGRTIEFWAECAWAEKTKAQTFVHEWTEGASVSATVAVAPQPLWWHRGSAEDSRSLRSEREIQRFAGRFPHGFKAPLEVIGCTADAGLPVSAQGNDAWLLGVTPGAALANAAAEAIERGIVTAALGSSTLDCLAALTTALKLDGGGTVRLWDIGRKQSHVFTVGIHGVQAVTTCPIGFETLFVTAQQLLGTKNSHEAARIFFGAPPADPAFGARLAAALKPQLETALQAAPATSGPESFACTGLTRQQEWFGQEMAAALGLTHWSTDLVRYLNHLDLRLSPAISRDAPSLAMLGALHLAAAPNTSTTPWHPTWGGISRKMTAPPGTPEYGVAPPQETSPSALPSMAGLASIAEVPSSNVAADVRPSVVSASSSPAPSARTNPASKEAVSPIGRMRESGVPYPDKTTTVPEQPASPPPVPSVTPPSVPTPAPAPPRASVNTPTALPATPIPLVPPAAPLSAPAPAGNEIKPPARPETAASGPVKRPEPVVIVVRKRGYWLHVGLLLALVGAALAWKFYIDRETTQAAAEQARIAAAEAIAIAERDKVAAEEHVRRATKQIEEADQRARTSIQANAASTAKIQREAEEARRAEVAQARRDAEEQTRRSLEAAMAAARAATATGGLKIASSPEGADVQVDDRPAQRSPVAIDSLAPGPHRVRMTLAGHVPKELKAEIAGSKVTDLGVVKLERATGSASVSSTPAGVEFRIRPANTPAGSNPLRQGQTPAQLNDLPAGNYVIHFKRPGWPDRSERITVEPGEIARIDTVFQGGTVTITSEPPAQVSHNGLALGATPLTLNDVPPGEVTYELTAEGYEPLKLSGAVVGGRGLQLEGKLLGVDRLVSEAELRSPPRPYLTTPLQLGRIPRSTPAYIKVSFVVLRDGSLYDIAILDKIDRKVQQRALEAMAKWKYYPGVSRAGYPVNVRITIPVKIARS